MLGWINDCVEKLVIEKFGVEVWHAVKEKAGCEVKDGGFLKLEHYTDNSTTSLVDAASELSGLTVPQVYEAFGVFFVAYVIDEGYENLLCCQGSTLKDWMTNINAIHSHLQTTFPKKMIMPEFWCEENGDGTLSLFYFSTRGNFLSPLAAGLVTEVAKRQFDLSIVMTRRTSQGVDGAKFTSWIVSTENPADIPKLRSKQGASNGVLNAPTSFKCPMSGMEINANDIPSLVVTKSDDSSSHGPGVVYDQKSATSDTGRACPFQKRTMSTETTSTASTFGDDTDVEEEYCDLPGGLSPAATRRLFPYHVVMDSEFCITQVGSSLSRVLGTTNEILHGNEIDEVFDFVKPKPAKWTRSWLRKLEDQDFLLVCTLSSAPVDLFFKGTVVFVNRGEAMLILSPDAKNLEELRDMKLTLSDLPAHGAYRDAVFLREHLSKQMNNALRMEKLSRTLQTEKDLLESLIPQHAAEGLRKGKTVEPMQHSRVTMFFSDVVGFTNICEHLAPTEIIDMLNKLYGIMDFLAKKFALFKIETIGDAYVCCSGLPDSDDDHAINVANFAIAVQHCCQRVRSPLDGSPIQLRVGINSGSCASGIVGVTNPRYCVFGDTVNTTARHESTGEAGRVHCSLTTMIELDKQAGDDDFHLISRGMVEMKGKGQLPTYWLEASEHNARVGEQALERLDEEIAKHFKGSLEGMPSKSTKEKDSLVSQMKQASRSSSTGSSQRRSRGVSVQDDNESTRSSTQSRTSSSTCSSTPSRKDLARMVSRSSSGRSRQSRTTRRQQRDESGAKTKTISQVVEVVER